MKNDSSHMHVIIFPSVFNHLLRRVLLVLNDKHTHHNKHERIMNVTSLIILRSNVATVTPPAPQSG